ncbi:MAG: hypothetical protein LUC34_08160 [Campylobacter sp.]|nr:hypothetical protein [Campylobacter sp.]
MQQPKVFELSTTRLPFDHFISGALIGGMSAAAISLNTNASKVQTAKKILKFSICGGFATAIAISTSNSIAKKEYLNAVAKISLGVGGLLLAEKFVNLENK